MLCNFDHIFLLVLQATVSDLQEAIHRRSKFHIYASVIAVMLFMVNILVLKRKTKF